MEKGQKKVFEFPTEMNGMGNLNFAWSQDYSFIAVCGENRNLYVINRKGKKLKEITLPNIGKVQHIDWDKDNEFVCVLQEGLSFVTIWNVFADNKIVEIEVGNPKEKATFAKWSKTHPVLAIGTDKGGLIFYNKRNQRRIPTIGKHTKKIISGDWNKEGLLMTGADDKLLTVSNHNADTAFDQMILKHEPQLLRWGRQKTDDREVKQRTVVSVFNKKTILMFEIQGTQPLELVFEQKYGTIVDYSLFGDGYIVVGFQKGWVAHISTHIKELKEEVSSEQIFLTTLDALATNDTLYKLAVAGENTIRFYNLSTWKEIRHERIELPKNAGKVLKLEWVPSGQLLVASTASGQLYGFLTAPFSLTSTYNSYVSLLTSFTEVTILDCTRVGGEGVPINTIDLEIEPEYLAHGQYHVGVGMNNLAYYYRWYEPRTRTIMKGGELRREKDYFASIKQLAINSFWAAVLADGKCFLHPIEQENQDLEKRFPSTENEKPIIQIGLTDKFLVLLESSGKVKFFHLEDQVFILEHKTDNLITKFYPNPSGTRLICNDNTGLNTVLSAADDSMINIVGYPQKTERIIWDAYDSNQFITIESESIQVFQIAKYSIHGPSCSGVKEYLSVEDLEKEQPVYVTNLEKGVKPLILNNGYLFFLTPGGTIQGQYLASHSYLPLWRGPHDTPEGHFRYFLQSLSLLKFSNCLVAAGYIDAPILYTVLGKKCLESLELEIAYRSYQKGKNLSMVLTIESFKHETETNILLGNVAMIFGAYDIAEAYFLKSSKGYLALDMRCDIQDWSIALNLSKSIAPEQEQLICRRLATQVESQGNNAEALRLYEKALIKPELETRFEKKFVETHNLQCYAGIARSSIKLGDLTRGLNITNQLEDNQQIIEIAMVCENSKNFLEAAQLYEKTELFEKAASIYITLRIFNQATQLISKIKSPKLLVQLAKAKESEGAYKEAEDAYYRAEDWENVIKINLNHLDNVKKAKEVCKTKCPTQTCANMIATYLEKKGAKEESIEFLVMSGLNDKAFNIAISTGNIEAYVEMLKDIPSDEALRIAQFLEGKNRTAEAAKYYEISGNPLKALKLFLQAGQDNLGHAIELVARVKAENLIRLLLDYLVGETDNIPKDPKWTFRLYMALGDLQKAARIALTIAKSEQESGNYKSAHSFLYEIQRELKEKNFAIPWDLYQRLLVLHSYVIVKRLVKMKEDETAARMLTRVCKNISQFPAHDVRILTSAAFQGMKSGLKSTAYQWALLLMSEEYRNNIAEEHKKKIETIVRKPTKEELEERLSPCPFCKEPIPETQLECGRCQNKIAYCIASGKHIELTGCAFCPKCNFPAIAELFRRSLEVEGTCPMCEEELLPEDVQEVSPGVVLDRIKIKRNEEEKEGGETTRDTSRTESAV